MEKDRVSLVRFITGLPMALEQGSERRKVAQPNVTGPVPDPPLGVQRRGGTKKKGKKGKKGKKTVGGSDWLHREVIGPTR